jgi:hypothetical protein
LSASDIVSALVRAASGQGKASSSPEVAFRLDSPAGAMRLSRLSGGESPLTISTACPLVVLGAGRWLLWRHCRGGCSYRCSPATRQITAGRRMHCARTCGVLSTERSERCGAGPGVLEFPLFVLSPFAILVSRDHRAEHLRVAAGPLAINKRFGHYSVTIRALKRQCPLQWEAPASTEPRPSQPYEAGFSLFRLPA